jgi:hypothetical protein
MTFEDTLDQGVAMLRRRGRVQCCLLPSLMLR